MMAGRVKLLVSITILAFIGASAAHAERTGSSVPGIRVDKLNQQAPLLELGNGKTLRDYRGQWVVLHFWATWCAPCLTELPSLDRLSQRWKGEAVFFAVSIDEDGDSRVEEFVNRTGISLPVVLKAQARAPDRYWSWGIPVTYFINPEGKLVARALGPREWDSPAADGLVAEFTNGLSSPQEAVKHYQP